VTERVPLAALPGIPALARGLATGDPDVSDFLPDAPSLERIFRRAREVLKGYAPRAASSRPDLTSGEKAIVFAGQQAGLFTGPLVTLVKALAVHKLAADLERAGAPARAAFWCASEDHDLVEVTRVPLPGPAGVEDAGPDPEPLAANHRPVGSLPIDCDLAAILERAQRDLGAPADPDALTALRELNQGQTFLSGFTRTLDWILAGAGVQLPVVDAASAADKPDLVPLAARFIRERAEVRRILDERADRLKERGFPLQVTSDPSALPLFAIVGGERCLLREEGSRLALKGIEGAWETEEAVAKLDSGEWLPSFSALSRPVAASLLFPVAAQVLGPAEIAYWAQSLPLFGWAGMVPPVLVPRPLVAVVEPSSKRILERLSLPLETALHGPEEMLKALGGEKARATLARLEEIRAGTTDALAAQKDALVSLDPSLAKALETTSEKVAFALAKLIERTAETAGRSEETAAKQVARLALALCPGGRLAPRVYTPLTYLLRLGRAGFVEPLASQLSWEARELEAIET
jgi:bacillithiol synthase